MYLYLLLPCLLDESHLQLCSSFCLHLLLMKTWTQHVPGMYNMRHYQDEILVKAVFGYTPHPKAIGLMKQSQDSKKSTNTDEIIDFCR